MRVAGNAPGRAALEKIVQVRQGRLCQRLQPVVGGLAERHAHLRGRLFEILPGIPGDGFERRALGDLGSALSMGMKRCETAGKLCNRLSADVPALEMGAQRGRIGQSLHFDCPFDRSAARPRS